MSRPDRVGQRIKSEVSEILRKQVDDPRIGFVTITDVSVSPDIKNAVIFVSILGDEKTRNDSMEGLESAKKFIRGILGDKLKLRTVPEISFKYDSSIEKASRIWNLMKDLK